MTKREGRGLLTGEKESGILTCGGGGAALHNSFKTSLLYLGSSSLSSIDCLYEYATCKEQAGGPAVVCRSASPMAKSVLVSENPFVFRVFEVRTIFAEEVSLYILHIRGLSFRLLWEEGHVDCRRGISFLLFRKGNPHFKEGFC